MAHATFLKRNMKDGFFLLAPLCLWRSTGMLAWALHEVALQVTTLTMECLVLHCVQLCTMEYYLKTNRFILV